MTITVLANDGSWNELVSCAPGINWIRAASFEAFVHNTDAGAFFNLHSDAEEKNYAALKKPVFINSVCTTLKTMKAAENVYRINGWSGFIKRPSWEIAGAPCKEGTDIITLLNKKAVFVPDEPGFISARIIAMIINEAFFAKAENVSTEKEIDIAMKLGTNYPFGPFEWARLIGIHNIYSLLKNLSENDERYTPSSLIEQEALQTS